MSEANAVGPAEPAADETPAPAQPENSSGKDFHSNRTMAAYYSQLLFFDIDPEGDIDEQIRNL